MSLELKCTSESTSVIIPWYQMAGKPGKAGNPSLKQWDKATLNPPKKPGKPGLRQEN